MYIEIYHDICYTTIKQNQPTRAHTPHGEKARKAMKTIEELKEKISEAWAEVSPREEAENFFFFKVEAGAKLTEKVNSTCEAWKNAEDAALDAEEEGAPDEEAKKLWAIEREKRKAFDEAFDERAKAFCEWAKKELDYDFFWAYGFDPETAAEILPHLSGGDLIGFNLC